MRNATLLALLVCASAVGGCLHRPPPPAPDQPSGLRSEIGPRLNNWSQATVPADGLIVVSGDDFVKPGVTPPRLKARKGSPPLDFAEVLARDVAVTVEDEAKAGATLKDGAVRLASGPAANLVVIDYGFGDAFAGTKPAAFRSDLQAMIQAAQARGAAVYVVVEPPTAAPLSKLTEPFRQAARDLAAANGAGLIDVAPPPKPGAPAAVVQVGVMTTPAKTPADLDLSLIAGQVAQYVKVAPAAGVDGQSGH